MNCPMNWPMSRLALLLMALGLQAMAAEPAKPAAATGTTIVSEDDAAIGLYLTPWKDEELRPAARSPSRYTQRLAPADPAADQTRNAALDSIDSYQRSRRQSLSY